MSWGRRALILAVLLQMTCSKRGRSYGYGNGYGSEQSGDDYIIGGSEVKAGTYPWMVHLMIGPVGKRSHCGGSLISRHLILTAAHCVDANLPIKAFIGSNIKGEGNEFVVTRKLVHSGFNRNRKLLFANFDIALLFVRDPVLNVQPISLIHPRAEIPSGTIVIALGWGRTHPKSKGISSVLQEVDLIVSPCTPTERKTITETALCTRTPSKDTCNGDSGGPIVIQVNGIFVQVGLTSVGMLECAVDNNSFYTDLRLLGDWVRQNLKFGEETVSKLPWSLPSFRAYSDPDKPQTIVEKSRKYLVQINNKFFIYNTVKQ